MFWRGCAAAEHFAIDRFGGSAMLPQLLGPLALGAVQDV